MRVTTGMVFDTGTGSILRQTATLLHTQQQVASGRRILSPSDDPVAAARALDVTQAKDINAQYSENQKNAGEMLGLQETALSSVGDLLTRARELAVQAGNAALNNQDRQSIGTELRGIFSQLMGLANTTDGSGLYQFSGYRGATTPFSGSVESGVTYAGDDGQRLLQVSASRQIAVSDAGSDVFLRIREGNGYFKTAANAANTGSGVIGAGTVTDPAKWAGSANSKNFTIRFAVSGGATTYDIVDNVSGNSLLTGAAPGAPPYPRTYTSGNAISLSQAGPPAFDFGASVVISGQPADGDSFTLNASANQSVFQTLGDLVTAVETPGGATGNALLSNRIGTALTNLGNAQDNVLRVRASVGARMNELDQLQTAGDAANVQYEASLSRLQDVDYASAISDLTKQQTYLEAAQKSFMKISGLSLFNFV